jgi:hypothetical protein
VIVRGALSVCAVIQRFGIRLTHADEPVQPGGGERSLVQVPSGVTGWPMVGRQRELSQLTGAVATKQGGDHRAGRSGQDHARVERR